MIDAIFLDFDGTVFSHKTKMIPDSAYKAILTAQSKNIKIILSTGRDIEEIKTFDCRGLLFDGYILNNGQLLLDKDLNIIEANYIQGKAKEEILDLFNNNKYPIVLRGLNIGFLNYKDSFIEKSYHDVDSDLPPIKKYEGEDLLVATIAVKNDGEKNELMNLLKDLNVTWWHKSSCDAVSKGSDKVVGVHKMLDFFHINKDKYIAVGDGENDIEMIKDAPIGIAMGNSIEEVKKNADYTTSDIDEDGLINAFRKFNII